MFTKWYYLQIRHPVNCEMEEILVSLDIRTRQCVFSGNYPCGHHGICQEIHRDILYYTTCKCFEGLTIIYIILIMYFFFKTC